MTDRRPRNLVKALISSLSSLFFRAVCQAKVVFGILEPPLQYTYGRCSKISITNCLPKRPRHMTDQAQVDSEETSCQSQQDLTKILKIGVQDSSSVKNRSPTPNQNLGVRLSNQ